MNTNSLPSLVVVGAQQLADILAGCGASWQVFPAVQTVGALWDAIESGQFPNEPTVLIVSDGTSAVADEMEQTIAVFAPHARTFVVASSQRGPHIIQRAQALAHGLVQSGSDPNAPVYFMPAENLNMALEALRNGVQDVVYWPSAQAQQQPAYQAQPQQPAYQAQPQQPAYQAQAQQQPAYPTQQQQPAYQPQQPGFSAYIEQNPNPSVVAATTVADGTPTVGMPQGANYEQSSVYDPRVAELASQVVQKRPDAIRNQVTIACMSSKGGSGKSTTAICLAGMIASASAAAGDPKKVVVVDLDTRDGQVGSLIGQYMPTAVSIRLLKVQDANAVQQNLVHDSKLGIDALLAPIRPRNADDVGPDFYRHVIQILQTTHDVVILDCSVNYLDPLLGTAFSLADEILFVTTLATTSVQGMARALTELFAEPSDGGLGIPQHKVGIVANAVINNVGMGMQTLMRAALGAPLVGAIPAEYDEVLINTNNTSMHRLLRHPRLGVAYFKLAKTCVPNLNLAPLTPEAAAALQASSGGQQAATQTGVVGGAVQQPKKKGSLFGR